MGAYEGPSSSQPPATPTQTSTLVATATLQPTNTPLASFTPTRTATLAATATLQPTNTPLASSTPTRTATFTATATIKPTNTLQPTNTPLASFTPTRTATFTATATLKPTNTLQPTNTPLASFTPTRTATFTATATLKPTNTLQPTNTPLASFTPTRTATLTATSTLQPTNTPSASLTPTRTPTFTPTASPLTTIALITPTDGMALLNNQPAFEWSDVSNAINYNVQISKNSTFTQLVTNSTMVSPNYTPAAYLPAGKTLYWRVRAKLATSYGQWSATYSLHTALPPTTPKLVKPGNEALLNGYIPVLDWTDSSVPSGASTFDHYLLEVATNPTFTNATEISVNGLKNSQYTFPSELGANSNFYWRVRPYNSNGEYGVWSSVRTFRTAIQPPTMLEPEEGLSTTNRTPTFAWSEVEGASSYILRVSKNSTFSSSILKVTVTTGSYTPSITLPGGTLYWRVQAKGANGPSLWSEVRTLIEN